MWSRRWRRGLHEALEVLQEGFETLGRERIGLNLPTHRGEALNYGSVYGTVYVYDGSP